MNFLLYDGQEENLLADLRRFEYSYTNPIKSHMSSSGYIRQYVSDEVAPGVLKIVATNLFV